MVTVQEERLVNTARSRILSVSLLDRLLTNWEVNPIYWLALGLG